MVLDINFPVPQADFTGTVSPDLQFALTIPELVVAFELEGPAFGVLNVNVPVFGASFTAEVSTAGVLDVTIPVPQIALVGELPPPAVGTLNVILPVPNVSLVGQSAAGGATVGPCGWTIPDPLCPTEAWTNASPAVQAAGRDYAALILWAATGRQFGLCEVSVRPCGQKPCNDGLLTFTGWNWLYGTWQPYIFNGVWFNCACPGLCCCDPRCQVRLMGPVDSIIEVLIGGIAVDPATYRVDDDHWLVRTGGECWPECADMNNDVGDNVFEVTYLRGTPVPVQLLRAASVLAMEWVAACTGGDCRLSNRVTSLVRSGISIEMATPSEFMDQGLTGIWEIDSVILALNPNGKKQRGRIYAPEMNVPRMVTSP